MRLDAFLCYVHGHDVRGDDFVEEVRGVAHSCCEDFEWLEDFMTVEEDYADYYAGYYAGEIRKGTEEAALETLAGLVRDGLLDSVVAADRAGLAEDEFLERVGLMHPVA